MERKTATPEASAKLARDFASAAKTFRGVRLDGLTMESESHQHVFEVLAFQAKPSDRRAA
jgi:hypothetical protein